MTLDGAPHACLLLPADGTLGTQFHTCIGKIREAAAKQAKKVASALVMPDGRQVRFTPEARQQIPDETLAEIRCAGGRKGGGRRELGLLGRASLVFQGKLG